jgi:uncharacterized protein
MIDRMHLNFFINSSTLYMEKCSSKCCPLTTTAMVLVLIGAINWGLIGVFDLNLVNNLLGQWEVVERVIYILVGLAGVFLTVKKCMTCKK